MADEKDTETPGTGAAESDDAALNDAGPNDAGPNDAGLNDAGPDDPGATGARDAEPADEVDPAVDDPDASDQTGDGADDVDELADADELDARFAEQVGSAADDSDDSDDDSDDDTDDDTDGRDEDELVGVGAGRSERRRGSGSDVATAKSAGRPKKDRPTPKQRTERAEEKRSGPIDFVKGSIGELKKVVYPTGPQLGNLFVVVLIFVLMVIAIVTALDAGFGWLMLRIFT